MAQVLSFPSQTDGAPSFGPDSLHRSSSQTSLLFQSSNPYTSSPNHLKPRYAQAGNDNRTFHSLPSSAPSSPRLSQRGFSNQPSYTSTPSSSLSLDEQCSSEDADVDINFPSYDDDYFGSISEAEAPAPLESHDTPNALSLKTDDSTLILERREKPSPSPTAGDDLEVRREPTRHVDYLSHNWREEDIWCSWRHVVARRNVYSNSTRLENASWRTWAKSKYRLKTVSPETLNWMKDHDVTWLYGPLQTDTGMQLNSNSGPAAGELSRSNSFTSKKPILKKRSPSELMFQRSISSSTLIRQATDAIRAQQPVAQSYDQPILSEQNPSNFSTSSCSGTPSTPSVDGRPSFKASTNTSGRQTPCAKRHIHFNNRVEQCIAINGEHDQCGYGPAVEDDSDSEEEMLIMKPVTTQSRPSTPRNSFSNESKTITMLPSTTLKYRSDTPDPIKQQDRQKGGMWSSNPKILQSPSQETLKPSSPSSNFLLDDEDDDIDMNWQPSAGRRDSIYLHRSQLSSYNFQNEHENTQPSGLRRTPSGMFMPYDDEEYPVAGGLYGKVIDTVNTARDIAHVIWNVGWRR
ncbi:MAG: hypothetical protein LQ351_008132 [Letrouitia transgressa]|nr:MAG: hypothetical protein LQ351_008132 [Letrouitia transgressa]